MYNDNKEHKRYKEANLKLQSIRDQFTHLVRLYANAKKETAVFMNNKTQSTYDNAFDSWIALRKAYPNNQHEHVKEADEKIKELKDVFFNRK